jgi:hypothetical protein
MDQGVASYIGGETAEHEHAKGAGYPISARARIMPSGRT